MSKTIRTVALTALATLGAVGLLSTPAFADESSTRGSNEKIKVIYSYMAKEYYVGNVRFYHKGDKFVLYRSKSPGNRIYAQYRDSPSDDWTTISGPLKAYTEKTVDKNLPEDHVYQFRGCVQLDDFVDQCSGVQHFTS